MLGSFFLLSGVVCVLVWALVVCAKEVQESREVLDEQSQVLREMVTSLTKTQGRSARSLAMRSQSFAHILRDVPGVDDDPPTSLRLR